MLARIRGEDIGGGVVKFGFRVGAQFVRSGTKLTAEQIAKFSPTNRQALIDKGMLAVWPKSANEPSPTQSASSDHPAPRHIVHTGRGQYDVIEGHKLNDGPLKKADAQTLAGVPKDN